MHRAVAAELANAGLQAYIDWEDAAMLERPDERTCERIAACDLFIFLATPNSRLSRWCPWEIGVAHGVKRPDQIVLIQTQDDSGRHYGSEYLRLYRNIDVTQTGRLAVFDPGKTTTRTLVASL